MKSEKNINKRIDKSKKQTTTTKIKIKFDIKNLEDDI
jgi:hypothetical protein